MMFPQSRGLLCGDFFAEILRWFTRILQSCAFDFTFLFYTWKRKRGKEKKFRRGTDKKEIKKL